MRILPPAVERVLRVRVSQEEEDEDDLPRPPRMERAVAFALADVHAAADAVLAVATSGPRGAVGFRRSDGSERTPGERRIVEGLDSDLSLHAWSAGAKVLISQPDPDGTVGVQLKMLQRGETRTYVHFY